MNVHDRFDPNTGLLTQSFLLTLLEHELARAKRHPAPIAILRLRPLFDPAAGGEVEASAFSFVGQILSSGIRAADIAGHYEDDLLVILPVTDRQGGVIVARRLLGQLCGVQRTRRFDAYQLSACIGVVAHPSGFTVTPQRLIAQAAQALRAALQKGPGTVICYDEIQESEQESG